MNKPIFYKSSMLSNMPDPDTMGYCIITDVEIPAHKSARDENGNTIDIVEDGMVAVYHMRKNKKIKSFMSVKNFFFCEYHHATGEPLVRSDIPVEIDDIKTKLKPDTLALVYHMPNDDFITAMALF